MKERSEQGGRWKEEEFGEKVESKTRATPTSPSQLLMATEVSSRLDTCPV